MSGKVVHVDPETHQTLREWTQETGKSMSEIVRQMVRDHAQRAQSSVLVPVQKKRLPLVSSSEQEDPLDVMSRPPFWATSAPSHAPSSG